MSVDAAGRGVLAPAPAPPVQDLATFAVVGTVLHRAAGSARAVHYAVAHRLRRDGLVRADVEVVVRARQQAEEWARARRGAGCTLDDVAVELARLLDLDEDAAARLVDTETAVERDGLRVVPGGLARVQAARAVGSAVGFVEDTLLPARLLREALEDAGAARPGDGLWLSHELGADKSDGGLYLEVARRSGRPEQWVHVGHDPDGDVRMARRAGVTGEILRDAAPTRYEAVLDGACTRTGGLSGLLAGASRSTRLRLARERPAMPRERAEVVAGVAGPLLAGYVLWCLRRAAEAGLPRLYFVARDGEVMLAMARRLAPALQADGTAGVDLRYLHGSRKAWLRSAPQADLLESVLSRQERLTVRSGLGWLGRSPEELRAALAGAGLEDWDTPLDADARGRLVAVAVAAAHQPGSVGDGTQDGTTAGTAAASAAAAGQLSRAADRDVLGRYLADVGLLDGTPYAIVDGAGHGTIGSLLTDLVRSHGGQGPALECYYGLDGPGEATPGRRPTGYAYDEWAGSGLRQSTDLWVALEMFTTASHGGVLGYEVVRGHARAVLGPLGAAEGWGAPDVRAGLQLYAEELAGTLAMVDPDVDVRAVTDEVATLFWASPTRQEVRSWGTFPFEASTETYPVARPFSTADVARSLLQGRLRLRRRGSWPAGTVRSAPLHLRLTHLAVGALRPRAAALRRVGSFWVDRRTLGRATGPGEPGRTTTEEDR
ncbi:hypothetical protein [Aquipuribacter hungaricus]|uniref:Uncharacterized protein n=1 Tax=Aquipuribacter hungaricus TaxID=545624 RepID=A0ABV7WE99_9MICO